ncbi:MAG: MerR family transcriptional regulator [Clostridiales bacterium]|jgi:DNA-binding transcriptional MerR regulator|nr:MerR family transcriptional regulator [Clostridiales bacterium]
MERRLNITEAAALYQISTRTLRYYEEVGILKSHRKTDSKYREYDRAQCERLEIILLLRRLSFSVRMIAELLHGDDAQFRTVLNEKIAHSGKRLLETRETDRLLRDMAAELSRKPITALNASQILSKYTYLTCQTERIIPMNSPQSEKYRVAIGEPFAIEVCTEDAGSLIEKIASLRAELNSKSVSLPQIRLYDNGDLPPNQVVIFWNATEVWRKDYNPPDAVTCADEIIEQLRSNALKN